MPSPTAEPVVITVSNTQGLELEVMSRGAVIRALRVPDRDGRLDDVVLGYDDVQSYVDDRFYLGAAIGRYANRIAGGRFSLDGRTYQLPINDSPNHLHGGPAGFHTATWQPQAEPGRAVLSYRSVDGEAGYPGNLEVEVSYTLTDANELIVAWRATTDRSTPLNLTQHSYFNLRGAGSGTINQHRLRINADHYLPVDETSIPTGERRAVQGTPFDFTVMRPVLDGRAEAYDHCYVLRGESGVLREAAELYEPKSGRVLTVLTTEPGMQLYTGQFLQLMQGKGATRYQPYCGLCLETQRFPDAPNQPSFPSAILRPGTEFRSTTIIRFGIR